jgi:hypothetical protein
MTPRHRSRRVRAWIPALALVLACFPLASCGGSSASHAATSTNSASTPASGGTGSTGSTATTPSSKAGDTPQTGTPAPAKRASNFVECLRNHGVKPPATASSTSGATLDFKGLDTSSKTYKAAIKACVGELVGKLPLRGAAGRRIKVPGIKIRGLHLPPFHIGHIEIKIPNIKVGDIKVKLPSIHVTTPPVHVTVPPTGETTTSGEPGREPES